MTTPGSVFATVEHVDQLREAIRGATCFDERRVDDYVVFNYKVRSLAPPQKFILITIKLTKISDRADGTRRRVPEPEPGPRSHHARALASPVRACVRVCVRVRWCVCVHACVRDC
jgi:hypothetical protein